MADWCVCTGHQNYCVPLAIHHLQLTTSMLLLLVHEHYHGRHKEKVVAMVTLPYNSYEEVSLFLRQCPLYRECPYYRGISVGRFPRACTVFIV